jgi:Bacterial dnaA protein helix-turn-helix
LSVEGFYREHYSSVRKRLMGKISKSVMTDIPEEKEKVKVNSSEWWIMDMERRHKKQLELEQRKNEVIQRAVENWGATPLAGSVKIIKDIARQHGITYADIIGPNRTQKIYKARHHAIHAVKAACPNKSLPELGRMFGNRDHTTILHALQKPCTLTYKPSDLQERMPDWDLLACDNTP